MPFLCFRQPCEVLKTSQGLKNRLRKASYQLSEPWQEFEEQLRLDAFQPMLVTMFLTPLLCVAVLTVVLLKPLPWQEEQERLR